MIAAPIVPVRFGRPILPMAWAFSLLVVLGHPLRAQGGASSTTLPAPDLLTWLENPDDSLTQIWVSGWTGSTARHLRASRRYDRFYLAALASYQHADQGSPLGGSAITIHQGYVYANYRDASEPRGGLRRATMASFTEEVPRWEPLLSVDSLARTEEVGWSLRGTPSCLGTRCLVTLASEDRLAIREYDLESRTVLPNGYSLSGSVAQAEWLDGNRLLVITGEPRRLVLWARDSALATAPELARAEPNDLDLSLVGFPDSGGRLVAILQQADARSARKYSLIDSSGTLVPLGLPSDARILAVHRGNLLVALGRSGWNGDGLTWREGAVVAVSLEAVQRPDPIPSLVFELANREAPVQSAGSTRDGVLLVTYQDLDPRLWRVTVDQGRWRRDRVALPDQGAIDIVGSDQETGAGYLIHQSPISPPELFTVDMVNNRAKALRQAETEYDVSGMVMERFEARSSDGVAIPYTIVKPKSFRNHQAPVLIAVHGAGGRSLWPRHDPIMGRLWLVQGGLYVIAHVRGGADLGPSWKNAGINRQTVDEDLAAVAKDLVRRRITTPRYLGLYGSGEGAAAAAANLNGHASLYKAAILESPVLDFNRWRRVDRFGEFDRPDQRTVLQSTSPYQNLARREDFPPVLLTAASRDTIYPWMARKYGERLTDLGKPIYYIERPGTSVQGLLPAESAEYAALVYSYLAERLMPLTAKMH